MDMAKPNMAGDGDGDGAKPDHHTPSCASDNKVYKGVRKRKWGKWVSEIRLPNSRERIWLGSHDSPEKAARAFDAALYCLRGCRANFNFPDTPFNLDINGGDQSLTPQEIQEVAARFANEVPHHDNREEPSQLSQRGANSSLGLSEGTYTTAAAASSTSTTMYECDGTVQVDHGENNISGMDWTFLKELDDFSEGLVGSDYCLYSELDKMHSGELLHSTPPLPPPFADNVGEIDGDYDPFSHQSFLWNWNF